MIWCFFYLDMAGVGEGNWKSIVLLSILFAFELQKYRFCISNLIDDLKNPTMI